MEVRLNPLDMGGNRRVRQKVNTLSVQAVRLSSRSPSPNSRVDEASLCVFPKNREEDVAQRPAGHCQPPDDRRPSHELRDHRYSNPSTAAGIADKVPVVVKVGEDFEKEFNRELENCTIKVRCGSKGRDRSQNTHFRWSEPARPFGLLRAFGVPLLSASVSVAWLF